MQGWNTIDPALRDQIEKGVPAIMRISRHETFQDWLAVGEALSAMQTAAMRLSGGNTAAGKGYNAAYRIIAEQVPDLAAIDKATRSHAIWLAANREAVDIWHARLPAKVRHQVNHPTTIRRRYDRDHAPGVDGAAKTERKAPDAHLKAELDSAYRRIHELEVELQRARQEDPQDSRSQTRGDMVIAGELFRFVKASLHPDKVQDPAAKEYMQTQFVRFTERVEKLNKAIGGIGTMTVDDMMQRRAETYMKNRERATKAAATKKAKAAAKQAAD